MAIHNVGEYYAAHYLAERFRKDIAGRIKIWRDQGSESAPRKLQALAEAYFKAKTRALDYPAPPARHNTGDPALDGWRHRLLEALGYTAEPMFLPLASARRVLPSLLRLSRGNRPWLVVLETPFCLPEEETAASPLELDVPSETRKDSRKDSRKESKKDSGRDSRKEARW
ncbi:MAG: hypothetical protein GY859_31660, partial [Desulfobacterales bacterium]|nr:hypothetical protein [Desulfobacterales bacterium]